MRTLQFCWTRENGWDKQPQEATFENAALILVFGATKIVTEGKRTEELRDAFPGAVMIGCTTGGEILGTQVTDECLVATVVAFAGAEVKGAAVAIADYGTSEKAAMALAEKIPLKGMRHLFVLADGVLTNGSEIARGLSSKLPENIPVTGGLAGDGMEFFSTYTIFNESIQGSAIVAVGFYGESLRIGYGSSGGWIPFGPQRMITASEGNTLYEVDGQSVLELYKQYLGSDAENLPASGLLFPLSILGEDDEEAVVRTILSVNDEKKSMSFAGDVPAGSYARFMRAVPDDLVDGAAEAAKITRKISGDSPGLCILISCIGRKLVLKQLTEEETEAVAEQFANTPVMMGFYSYGEIAPFREGQRAILHNQTMTITAISEEIDA